MVLVVLMLSYVDMFLSCLYRDLVGPPSLGLVQLLVKPFLFGRRTLEDLLCATKRGDMNLLGSSAVEKGEETKIVIS